mmetsp:Transcript_5928/g.6842  ORF Transcript_5928/g.6842 Transcript_5928/m.6842 type:complete len:83 (-) Transcript_5928:635-883(-)
MSSFVGSDGEPIMKNTVGDWCISINTVFHVYLCTYINRNINLRQWAQFRRRNYLILVALDIHRECTTWHISLQIPMMAETIL